MSNVAVVANLARVWEKNPVGLKVLERNVFVSNSDIKAEKEHLIMKLFGIILRNYDQYIRF